MPGGDGHVVLFAVQTGVFDKVATEGECRLLYRFDNVAAQPPTSNCTGPFADTWFVVTPTGEKATAR